MNQNLSQFQFAQEHADFDRWAKGEQSRLSEQNRVSPGHVRYSPEDGRKMGRLNKAREWLSDSYSSAAHASIAGTPHEQAWQHTDVPLEEALPFHTELVDEYRGQQR